MENGANGYSFSDKAAASGGGAAGNGNAFFGSYRGFDEVMGRHTLTSYGGGGGAVGVRISHPSHHYSNNSPLPFKSPAMGFPFTWTQWKELERQAMVYKYMMAAVPVPSDLLLPISTNTYLASHTTNPPFSGGNVHYGVEGKNRDLEPGRCKRTDGKKWRCAKEVAPNQKYCERHLHRGRPRSRKPVEDHHAAPAPAAAGNTASKKSRTLQPPPPIQSADTPSLSNFMAGSPNKRTQTFDDPNMKELKLSLSNFSESHRSFDWMKMMEGDMVAMGGAEEQWKQLMGTTTTNTRMNSFETSLLYNNGTSAYNNGTRADDDDDDNNNNYNNAPQFFQFDQIGRIKDDTNGGKGNVYFNNPEEDVWSNTPMATVGDNIGTWKPPLSLWAPFESGGPLGEVLKPSSSQQQNDGDSFSQAGTSSVSSPSGVLQQPKAATPFSQSDGSVCNSPTTLPQPTPASEMLPFQWLI
ncbi:unnamed protein product [Cuscuta epithymum]|uniref:Growth-regulating factor n=1 Tax=Cuscuta epithymum TaxID=186058 RepID=A0AAV0ELI5_9ASTE|nr:unnamed protein product [Cuscuta epithymum]